MKIMTVGKKASSFYKKTDLDIVASFEDLKSVEGIEEKVAKKIHDFFHDN